MRQILGYAPSEILGTNASQFVHPEDLAALDFAMHTLGANQRTATNLQARWRHRNGSYRWLERNMLALLDDGGHRRAFAAANATSRNGVGRKNTSAVSRACSRCSRA